MSTLTLPFGPVNGFPSRTGWPAPLESLLVASLTAVLASPLTGSALDTLDSCSSSRMPSRPLPLGLCTHWSLLGLPGGEYSHGSWSLLKCRSSVRPSLTSLFKTAFPGPCPLPSFPLLLLHSPSHPTRRSVDCVFLNCLSPPMKRKSTQAQVFVCLLNPQPCLVHNGHSHC